MTKTFDFQTYLADGRKKVEDRLKLVFDQERPALHASLYEAMSYSVLNGGKRLRALLCLASAQACKKYSVSRDKTDDQIEEMVMPLACALEMVHAMSLIHDDLPCLDNDELRRGKPTNHRVFGEAMALLAGDGLLVFANEYLIGESLEKVLPQDLLAVSHGLSRALGTTGMVGGQVLDMSNTGSADGQLDLVVLENIHNGKTGALIRFCLWGGARAIGADELRLSAMARFGEILGLAFQITDDLLDVTGDAASLGKTPGKDAQSNKATFVRLLGLDGARNKLEMLHKEGSSVLSRALDQNEQQILSNLLDYAINRIN